MPVAAAAARAVPLGVCVMPSCCLGRDSSLWCQATYTAPHCGLWPQFSHPPSVVPFVRAAGHVLGLWQRRPVLVQAGATGDPRAYLVSREGTAVWRLDAGWATSVSCGSHLAQHPCTQHPCLEAALRPETSWVSLSIRHAGLRCRWKVGFLASQLPRALPTRLLLSGGPGGGGSGGGPGAADGGYSLADDGLLLVGWWVPPQ